MIMIKGRQVDRYIDRLLCLRILIRAVRDSGQIAKFDILRVFV